MYLRQNTTSQEILLGPFLDDTDFKTPETALVIANTDIKLWKHGATVEVNKAAGGATHIAGGRYYAVLDLSDTNTTGQLEINVHVAGALPVQRRYTVLSPQSFDSIIAGVDLLQIDATQIAGSTTAATYLQAHALRTLPVTFAGGGTTTTAVLVNVDGVAASATDDVYNGRILIFALPVGLKDQVCQITDYVGATKTATITAVTTAVGITSSAIMV